METIEVVSAIDDEVRFFFIFLVCVCNEMIVYCKETDFFLFAVQFCKKGGELEGVFQSFRRVYCSAKILDK